jgi:PPOX class probable F420-dependent enzyme
MALTDEDREFLRERHSGAMITIARDGAPKVARVGVALIDGRLWSSATKDRVRTKRLRRDPRCTLYVYDATPAWRALETTVTILDGPDAPALNLRLFREMQGKPSGPLRWFDGDLDEEAFLRTMAEERRLVFEFEVHRGYGPG